MTTGDPNIVALTEYLCSYFGLPHDFTALKLEFRQGQPVLIAVEFSPKQRDSQ